MVCVFVSLVFISWLWTDIQSLYSSSRAQHARSWLYFTIINITSERKSRTSQICSVCLNIVQLHVALHHHYHQRTLIIIHSSFLTKMHDEYYHDHDFFYSAGIFLFFWINSWKMRRKYLIMPIQLINLVCVGCGCNFIADFF